jgi:hypothetical protein
MKESTIVISIEYPSLKQQLKAPLFREDAGERAGGKDFYGALQKRKSMGSKE